MSPSVNAGSVVRFASLAVALVLAAPAAAQTPVPPSPPERSWALSVQAGVVFPGVVYIEPNDWDTGTGLGLKAAADFFLMPRLSMGVYVQRIATKLTEPLSKPAVTMLALGGALVGHFGEADRSHLRLGCGFAYQTASVDRPNTKDANGFGIAPFAEYVFPVGAGSVFAHAGFNAQPAGGNADANVTWKPLWELAFGAEFGR